MMRDEPGCMGALLAWLLFGLFLLTLGGMSALPVLNSGGLSWDTSAAQSWQAQRTERERVQAEVDKVRAVEGTKQAEAWQRTLQVLAVAGGVAGALIVGTVQWGRTVRHRETQVTERVRLLEGYVARYYLPGDNVEVRTLPGRGPVVVDHDAGEIVPYDVARQAMQWPVQYER